MSIDHDSPRLTAYVLGELDAAEQTAFEAELESSAELRRAVEETRDTVAALAGALADEPSVALSDEQRATVLGEATTTNGPEQAGAVAVAQQSSSPRRRPVVMSLALAALLLIACGVGYVVGAGSLGGPQLARLTTVLRANKNNSPARISSAVPSDGKFDEMIVSQSQVVHEQGDWRYQTSSDSPTSSPSSARAGRYLRGRAPGNGQDAWVESLSEVEKSHIPAVEDPAISYPDAKAWQELTERRKGYSSVTLNGPSNETEDQSPAARGRRVGGGRGRGTGDYDGDGVQTEFESLNQLITTTVQPDGQLAGPQQVPAFGDRLKTIELEEAFRELTNGRDKLNLFSIGTDGRVDDNTVPGLRVRGGATLSPADDGVGPGRGGDKYAPIVENPFREVRVEPRSTFSIDVDTASYAKTRMYLLQQGMLPPPDAVRIEELVNYFAYDYDPPEDDAPFAARVEVAACPWRPKNRLVRVAIKGQEIEREERPMSNLVFLLDVSGSMNQPNKLPLLKRGMAMLARQLGENDRVAIVVYAGAAGMVLDSTTGDQQETILDALERLQAGGSTNGGEGIRLAYQLALDHFIKGGTNRVILCTDGDFNVGTTSSGELVELAEANAKSGVFLSVLGFGMGNHNDSMLEQISNRGNGNYAFIDSEAEARKVMVDEISGTLFTIAKDVKIQIEFNPAEVAAYRLIGYENRMLAAQDFNDDKKDAGEIGAGHMVTALYEIVPTAEKETVDVPSTDELKYQVGPGLTDAATSGELLTLKLRYKDPDADKSKLLSFPIKDSGHSFSAASKDFQFAASVASFGMLLRGSKYAGNATYDAVLEIAGGASSVDPHGYRAEFIEIVKRAKALSGK